jgi:hypothetical protein
MTPLVRRSLAAAPDAAAAAVSLWIWLWPLVWRRELVSVLVLALLMEFVAIQAGPFIGRIVYGARLGLSAGERWRKGLVLGAVYLAFAGLAGASFGTWLPSLLFLWLFGAKVSAAVLGRWPDAVGREREMGYWLLCNVLYFAVIFGAMFLPVPMLGVTEEGEFYGLRGRYEWANYPHEAVAAGFVYFAALALTRVVDPRIGVDM